eukprot:scaffold48105_cov30-Attheya_sp.AAC.5
MIVPEADCWHFAYVLPDAPGEPTRLVIHALQMGWTQSPGLFTAVTETVRDITQVLVMGDKSMPPHTMETWMVPEQPAKRQRTLDTTWQMSSVFVDDFILAAVENEDGTLLSRTAQAALHSIHGVFPPSTSGHKGGKDPVSERKLEKGDMQDGRKRTIQLTIAKADAIILEITRVLWKRKIPLKRFQKLLGKLQHAAGILPAAKSLFTPLNVSLRDDLKWIPIPVDSDVRYAMLDFKTLILQNLAARPTHVMELEFDRDDFVGYCDASAFVFGAGGVWFSGLLSLTPTLWGQVEWPSDITVNVVSDQNPDGTITNSDLEMAGVLIQQMVLERLVDFCHRRSIIHCDNTPSVSWPVQQSCQSQELITPLPISHHELSPKFRNRWHNRGHLTLHCLPTKISHIFCCSSPAAIILANCDPGARAAIERDIDTARQTIADATVDTSARLSTWRAWEGYALMCQIDPFFRNVAYPVQQETLLAFASQVRAGSYRYGRQVGTQSVEKALRHVAQTQVLAGYPDPRWRYGTKDLDLPFQHLLKSMRDEDPAPRPQVALPVDTITAAAAAAAAAALQPLAAPIAKATGDLITAAFYFLLRVGEYTMPSANRQTRTVQFRCQDVRLWRHQQLIPHTAPLEVLMMADNVTLYLDNHKNGQRGATIQHTSVPG